MPQAVQQVSHEAIWRRYDADEVRLSRPLSDRMLALGKLQDGLHVLDLATGRGEPAIRAAQLVAPDGRVTGVDIMPTMLEMARQRAQADDVSNLQLFVMDMQTLDGIADNSIDVAICRWGLMYAKDPVQALRSTRRVLRPSGQLVLALWAEPERVPYYSLPRAALNEFKSIPPIDFELPGTFRLAHVDRIERDLAAAGFAIDQMEELHVDVMEAANDTELIAWHRAFGMNRLLADMPAEQQECWERTFCQAAQVFRDQSVIRMGGINRIVVARPTA
jgi:ubiquinone/menaquinone biosynthesis C-methylase UbiE